MLSPYTQELKSFPNGCTEKVAREASYPVTHKKAYTRFTKTPEVLTTQASITTQHGDSAKRKLILVVARILHPGMEYVMNSEDTYCL